MLDQEIKNNLERRFEAMRGSKASPGLLIKERAYFDYLGKEKSLHTIISKLDLSSLFLDHVINFYDGKVPNFLDSKLVNTQQLFNATAITTMKKALYSNNPFEADFYLVQEFHNDLLEKLNDTRTKIEGKNITRRLIERGADTEFNFKGKALHIGNKGTIYRQLFEIIFNNTNPSDYKISFEEAAQHLVPNEPDREQRLQKARNAFHNLIRYSGLKQCLTPDGKQIIEFKRGRPSVIIFRNYPII